jgi:hypothetical protein
MLRANAVLAAIAATGALALSASPAAAELPSDPGCEGLSSKEANQDWRSPARAVTTARRRAWPLFRDRDRHALDATQLRGSATRPRSVEREPFRSRRTPERRPSRALGQVKRCPGRWSHYRPPVSWRRNPATPAGHPERLRASRRRTRWQPPVCRGRCPRTIRAARKRTRPLQCRPAAGVQPLPEPRLRHRRSHRLRALPRASSWCSFRLDSCFHTTRHGGWSWTTPPRSVSHSARSHRGASDAGQVLSRTSDCSSTTDRRPGG